MNTIINFLIDPKNMDILNIFGKSASTPAKKEQVREKGLSEAEKKFINEMPEKIDFEGLGDLDVIQDEFYSGLEDIEKQFHQLVEKAENNFDLKHS